MKITINVKKPKTCVECKFHSTSSYSCHNERGYMSHCSLGYMSGYDMRDKIINNRIWEGCKIKEFKK